MKTIHRLEISWSVSRGRDTYGYNICRLDDSVNRHRFRCMGGGYDMIGTVFAEWFQTYYPEKLKALLAGRKTEDCNYSVKGYVRIPEFYGLTFTPEGEPRLDGGCGIESMRRIVEACGFDVEWSGDKRGRTRAYYVQEK